MRNPYNYSFNNITGTYQFSTKNNIIYRVAFFEDSTLTTISTKGLKFENMYQIVIEKVTQRLEPLDVRVFLTIDSIISEFFFNVANALICVCSDDKGKGKVRYQVFERWYRNSEHQKIINKVDNVVSLDDENVIYTSLLYHKNNPNIKNILAAFGEIEAVLNKDE